MPTYKISQLTTATAVSATNQFEINQNGTSKSVAVSVIDAYIKSTSNLPVVVSVSSASTALRITQTGTGNALVVEDSANPDATPFVVDASGQLTVGASVRSTIGTVTPNILVQNNSSGTANGIGVASWLASTAGSKVALGKSRSATIGTPAIVSSGDTLATLSFAGDDGAAFIDAASIIVAVDGTPGLNDMPGRLVFSTTGDGASTPTERMRIGSTGNIGIGTSGTEPFTIRNLRNFSGATSAYGISQGGEIQSGVTGSVFVNHTAPTTQATAFTLGNVYHYAANSLTIGAGSTVNNQYGFFAQSSLNTATNNYGFYGNIASGANRWNFYAAGTADNYFAGQVQLGAGTVAAPALSTTGDTNTGIFFPAADTMAFAEGGAEVMRIDSSGNVGIGTSSPGSLLTVNGNLAFNSGYGSAAVAYGCRAWVNFNGTGTVAIRASGNVTSITDNDTGDYTINFTTAMPDANYSCVGQAHTPGTSNHIFQAPSGASGNQATGSVRIVTPLPNTGTLTDASFVQAAIFR